MSRYFCVLFYFAFISHLLWSDLVASTEFDFKNYFLGEFEIVKSVINSNDNSIETSQLIGKYNIQKENGTQNLVGRS